MAEAVRNRLLKLGQFHVEYVFGCLDKSTTKVYNIKCCLKGVANCPEWMRGTVEELIAKGVITGTTGSTKYKVGKYKTQIEVMIAVNRMIK